MQIQDDGTHAILPARRCPKGRRDRAKLPVTRLRQTDGKLRRDGYAAAIVQPRHAAAERGKLHGALGLLAVNELQIRARCRRAFDDEDGEHQWRKRRRRSWQRGRTPGRLKRQDKSGSPVELQTTDVACVQPCRSVVGRAATGPFANEGKRRCGTNRSVASSSAKLGSAPGPALELRSGVCVGRYLRVRSSGPKACADAQRTARRQEYRGRFPGPFGSRQLPSDERSHRPPFSGCNQRPGT